MATNKILPFAGTDIGSNLLTDEEYAADSQRPIGHQLGDARRKLANKALRQSAAIAAGVAQYIADNQGVDITDALTPAAVAGYLGGVITADTAADAAAANAAKAAAESARDAAIIGSGVYVDEPTGRAAVADGVAFKVQGSGDVAAYEYRRVSAASSTLIATYPSVALVSRARILATGVQTARYTAARSGTDDWTVGWATLRLLVGGAAVSNVADRTSALLANLQCVYIDPVADATPYPLYQAAYTTVAAAAVTGSKIILVGNYYGALFGLIAGNLYDQLQDVTVAAAQTNSERSRKVVAGEITKETWVGGVVTISTGEGRLLKENNAGNFEAKIAPVTNAALSAREGLIVDFTGGSLDGSGRYIPTVGTVASSGQLGWQTANKYVLVVNADGFAIGGQYRRARSTIGTYDAEACFSTDAGVELPTWNAATRTLTWPQLVMVIKNLNAPYAGRIKLQAGSIVVPAGNYYTVALDLNLINQTETPNTAVSVGQYYLGGWAGDDLTKIPLFAVSLTQAWPLRFPPTTGSTTLPVVSPGTYGASEIVVVKRSDEIDIYMKGSNPTSARYLRYRMERKTSVPLASDVWRWSAVWDCARTGDYAFTAVRQICNTGENEMAIMQSGKSDFIGGAAHGDEELFSIKCLVDGSNVTLGTVENFRCRRVEFLQATNMYEVDTAKGTRVAKAYRRHVFENGEVTITQHLVWEAAITLLDTYLAMLTAERVEAAVPSFQISDKGYRSPLWTEEDISVSGFTPIFSTANIVKASGPNGYSFEVEILEGWEKANRHVNISESPSYNKFYFDFTGTGYVTTPGEVMRSRARYKIDTRN